MSATPDLTFSEWIDFEARRIVSMGLRVPEEHRADYIYIQIRDALSKARSLGRQGLRDDDPMPLG
jgi:hypothetical protein